MSTRRLCVPYAWDMAVADVCHTSFPLFSRGVDTYRFEYGVFLLNKDIEMVRRLCASKHSTNR